MTPLPEPFRARRQVDAAELEPHTRDWLAVVDALSVAMLREATGGDHAAAAAAFRLASQLRGPWRDLMVCCWIDSLLHQQGYTATHDPNGQPRQVGGRLGFMSPHGHRVVDVDDVAPPQRWAGRLIAARAALDVDGQIALLATPPGGAEPDDDVLAVLILVVTTMSHHQAAAGPGRRP